MNKTGRKCKCYLDLAGAGQDAWQELTIVRNPQLQLAKDKAENSDRRSDFKRYVAGMKDAPLTLEITRDPSNALYLALRSAFLLDTTIGYAQASGPIDVAGHEVFIGDFLVFDFPLSEPLGDGLTTSVGLALDGDSAFEPTWGDTVAA